MAYARQYRRRTRPLARRPVRRPRVFARKKAPYRAVRPTRALKVAVQKALAPRIETKMRWQQVLPLNGTGSMDIPGGGLALAGMVATAKGIIAKNLFGYVTLQPGNSAQQRVGAQVTVKGFYVKMQVIANAYDSTVNPFTQPFKVHVLFYKNKTGQAADADPSTLLESFNNSTQAITGTAWDQMAPWNKASYTIKKYTTFKLKPPPATIEVPLTTGDEAVLQNPNFGSANTPVYRTCTFKVPVAKTFKYADGGLNVPRNDFLSMGIWTTQADGTAITASQTRAQVFCTARLYYTDM